VGPDSLSVGFKVATFDEGSPGLIEAYTFRPVALDRGADVEVSARAAKTPRPRLPWISPPMILIAFSVFPPALTACLSKWKPSRRLKRGIAGYELEDPRMPHAEAVEHMAGNLDLREAAAAHVGDFEPVGPHRPALNAEFLDTDGLTGAAGSPTMRIDEESAEFCKMLEARPSPVSVTVPAIASIRAGVSSATPSPTAPNDRTESGPEPAARTGTSASRRAMVTATPPRW
jgi:hypothetical protein